MAGQVNRAAVAVAAALLLGALSACAQHAEQADDTGGILPAERGELSFSVPGVAPGLTEDGVVVLAKVDGWRPMLSGADQLGPLVEIAYDRASAEAAWRENVPEGLTAGGEVPEAAGIYGLLDAVDFDRQALVVWSSGESSSCPAWLADIRTGPAGDVTVEERDTTWLEPDEMIFCTMDYRQYRMLLAVDLDRLPAPREVGTEVTTMGDVPVVRYPAG